MNINTDSFQLLTSRESRSYWSQVLSLHDPYLIISLYPQRPDLNHPSHNLLFPVLPHSPPLLHCSTLTHICTGQLQHCTRFFPPLSLSRREQLRDFKHSLTKCCCCAAWTCENNAQPGTERTESDAKTQILQATILCKTR